MALVRTEPFFGGAYWQADCPDGWGFRRDKSIDKYPYAFESDRGARLEIYTSLGTGRLNFAEGVTRPDIKSEPLRIAYVETLQDAKWSGVKSFLEYVWRSFRSLHRLDAKVRRRDLGNVVGFSYDTSDGWRGHLTTDCGWSLRIAFAAPEAVRTASNLEAEAILSSLQCSPAIAAAKGPI